MQVWAIIYDKANFPDSVRILISHLIEQNRHMSSSFITMLYPWLIRPHSRRSRDSIAARTLVVRHLLCPVLHLELKYCHHCYSIQGSLIGSILPRVLLKKRGLPKEALTFATTETGKPYCVCLFLSALSFCAQTHIFLRPLPELTRP